MLLYRCQPISSDQSLIVNLGRKRQLFNAVSEGLSSYKNKSLHPNDHTSLITDASVLAGLISLSGYENVLVVTSFVDKDYDNVVKNHRPHKSAGDHLLPIVHEIVQAKSNMYVTKVKNSVNWFDSIYESTGVKTLDVDAPFKLDGDFKIKTDVKFDAVVLLGCDAYKKGKFQAVDIKSKFVRYCTPEFDMIDVYRHGNDNRKVSGRRKNSTKIAATMFQSVNTPKKIIDKTTRNQVRNELEMPNMRSIILYNRLAVNVIDIDKWYRVY